MSDEMTNDRNEEELPELHAYEPESADDFEDEYEEIDPEEIERVIAVLNDLIERVESETIRSYLSDAAADVAYLLEEEYDEDEDEGGMTEAA